MHVLRERAPGDALSGSSRSRSPLRSVASTALKDASFAMRPAAEALSNLQLLSPTNPVHGARLRHVFVEKARYGRLQKHQGKVRAAAGPDALGQLSSEEVTGLERSYPFATILDGAQVGRSRRLHALYHQCDAEMSVKRQQLKYATDVLPSGARLKPAQPTAPHNRYFKKTRHLSVGAAAQVLARSQFAEPYGPAGGTGANNEQRMRATHIVPPVLPIPAGLAYQ